MVKKYCVKPGAKVDLKKFNLKNGQTAEFRGEMINSPQAPDMVLKVNFVDTHKKSTEHRNLAKAVGVVHSCDHFPAQPNQQAFTNLLLRCGQKLIRGVAWRALCRKWADSAVQGSKATLFGELSRRKMVNPDGSTLKNEKGEDRYSVDILCRDNVMNEIETVDKGEIDALFDSPKAAEKAAV